MDQLDNIRRVYFIGIGGIGMSALARYFNHRGLTVAGYDCTPSPLTEQLQRESIAISFEDSITTIPSEFVNSPDQTLVVYTPAVPNTHSQLKYFEYNGYTLMKRAKALGLITNKYNTAAVAGTHGKTSTSTLLAHLMKQTPQGCNAFLGGISKNFNSNLVLASKGSMRMVVEADEFDRSFLHLTPQLAIITSIDSDHLDIYNTHEEVEKGFSDFVANITPNGVLIVKKGLEHIAKSNKNINVYTYSASEKADFYAQNTKGSSGHYKFDLATPLGIIEGIELGVLGRYNVENAIAAAAAATIWGIDSAELKQGLKTFKGIARRFDLQYQGKAIYIDDYAHHPEELNAAIGSIKEMFPRRHITGVFQPHLYTRTRDFAPQFAQSLSQLDEVILLDIYPARELPIEGVTSEIIFNAIGTPRKHLLKLSELQDHLRSSKIDVIITMGAGNIDREVPKIVSLLKEREGK